MGRALADAAVPRITPRAAVGARLRAAGGQRTRGKAQVRTVHPAWSGGYDPRREDQRSEVTNERKESDV